LGILITLEEPTKDMIKTAKAAGIYQNKFMSQSCDRIQIVTIREILESNKRLDIRLSLEVLKSAEKQMEVQGTQMELDFENIINQIPGKRQGFCAKRSEKLTLVLSKKGAKPLPILLFTFIQQALFN